MPCINQLEKTFKANSEADNAFAMAKYMKDKLYFFGIKTPQRRRIFK